VSDFSEGLAAARVKEQVGYIDKTGKTVIAPQFDDAWAFEDGLALIRVGDKFGYIDKRGQLVWGPAN
jgi:hypothetical protein